MVIGNGEASSHGQAPRLCCDVCGLDVPCLVVFIQTGIGKGGLVEARCETCQPTEPHVVLGR